MKICFKYKYIIKKKFSILELKCLDPLKPYDNLVN